MSDELNIPASSESAVDDVTAVARSPDVDTQVYYGGAVKAVGDGRIEGYLIRFDDDGENRDLEGEYFTSKTYLGARDGDGLDTLFHHGIPIEAEVDGKRVAFTELADTPLPPIRASRDDLGIFAEVVMDMADEYQRVVYQLAESGKLGWSSGAAGHTVRRTKDGEITQWILAEGSLTPTPAEPRNRALPLKAIMQGIESRCDDPETTPKASPPKGEPSPAGAVEHPETVADDSPPTQQPRIEVNEMTEDMKTAPEEQTETPSVDPMADRLAALEKQTSDVMNALTKMMETEPRINRSGYISVDGGAADQNVKNVSDMLLSIKRKDHKRLTGHYGLKAQYESDGTTGGYYVPEQVLQDMLPGLSLTSGIGTLITRIPVQMPAGEMPIRDYSRTPTANAGNTASAQGIESQGRAEGGAYTEETAYFELLNYRVGDSTSGYVKASKELAQDVPAIQALLRNAIEEDVRNKEEYFILRGTGVNQPLGILNWAGTIDVAEDTSSTFAIADADEMLSRLMVRNPGSTVWTHHPSVITEIASFERGTGGAVYQSNIPGAMPESLHGYARLNTQHLPQQGSDGYVIFGDFSRYFMFELGGLYIDFSEEADFLNGNVVWRFGKRMDGKPAMTSAVTLADGSFTVSPFVAIQST